MINSNTERMVLDRKYSIFPSFETESVLEKQMESLHAGKL